MAVNKYKIYNLKPKRKTLTQKIMGWVLNHPRLVLLGVIGVVFIVTLMVLQVNAQADYLMGYGSG